MKKSKLILFFTVLFVLLSFYVVETQDDEQQIRNAYAALEIAFEAENINDFMYHISQNYFDECEDYDDFQNQIQYLFANYYNLEVNIEIYNITFSDNLAFVLNDGNWTGRNSDGVIEGESWYFEEDIWKKEDNKWERYGDQKRSWIGAEAGHNVGPWDDHYFLWMGTDSGCEDVKIISVNVTGPQISTVSLEQHEENFFYDFAEITPNIGDIYTFYIVYDDSYIEEIDDSVESLVESGPTITYPQHNSVINETIPVFTWTNASSAVDNKGYYSVRVSNQTDSEIWQINLPLTETSVQYNIDGTAEELLKPGNGYWFEVFIKDMYENYAYQRIYFEVSESLGDNILSGYVFDSVNKPLVNVPVELEDEAGTIWLTGKTDSRGYFEFTNLSQDEYGLWINIYENSPYKKYTTIAFEVFDNKNMTINLTEDLEINVTLLKINVSLEFDASIFRNGQTVEANVTVTNNENFALTDWAFVLGIYAEDGEEELYFNLTPTNLLAGETKSYIFTYKILENNTFTELYIFGGTGYDNYDVESSKGNLTALTHKIDEKEISIIILRGDVEGNCEVNIFDLAKIGLCYGCSSGQECWQNCEQADVKPDGVINIFDLATIGLNYGRTC